MKLILICDLQGEAGAAAAGGDGGAVKIFDQIKGMMNDSLIQSMGAVFQFELKGENNLCVHTSSCD